MLDYKQGLKGLILVLIEKHKCLGIDVVLFHAHQDREALAGNAPNLLKRPAYQVLRML
jgi:hypothetical protein